jgi:hypothetical protein
VPARLSCECAFVSGPAGPNRIAEPVLFGAARCGESAGLRRRPEAAASSELDILAGRRCPPISYLVVVLPVSRAAAAAPFFTLQRVATKLRESLAHCARASPGYNHNKHGWRRPARNSDEHTTKQRQPQQGRRPAARRRRPSQIAANAAATRLPPCAPNSHKRGAEPTASWLAARPY